MLTAVSALFTCRGALLSLNPGTLGSALSPALMSNSTLATIQGRYSCFPYLHLFFLMEEVYFARSQGDGETGELIMLTI